MKFCGEVQNLLHEYLDGRLNGARMRQVADHLELCATCGTEARQLTEMQHQLSLLGNAQVPPELLPRIQMAIAVERQKRAEGWLGRGRKLWHRTFGDFALQLAGGFASAVLLIGSVALMVGFFVQPMQVRADDEPIGMRTTPKFMYVSGAITAEQLDEISDVSVEVAVDKHGRVYDYRILSGKDNSETRRVIDNLLLFTTFEPARYYDQPVSGLAIMNFNGIDVKG